RDSLRFLLESAKLEVQTYDSASAFLALLSKIKGGCILTDVRMPQITGIELIRKLKTMSIDLPVVVMTGHGDISVAVEAMKAGAVDFLEKPFDDEVLLKSIHFALDRYSQTAKKDTEKARIRERIDSLSPREQEVLGGLVAGHANKVIAADLKISPR